MQFFKKLLLLILLFSINCIQTRGIKSKTSPRQASKPTAMAPQQPILKPQSYAHALNIIRTQMPSNKILTNNTFTQEFINFVTSLNLADAQMQALFEAGANLHASLTGNDQVDTHVLMSLKNTLPIKQSRPVAPIQPAIAPKPVPPMQPKTPVTPHTPKQPIAPIRKAPPGKQMVQQTPVKKNEQLPQVLPLADHFITNNLVMLLDPKRSETLETRVGAMVDDAVAGLLEKAAPIIMTSNILEIILQIRQRIGNSQQPVQAMPTVKPELLPAIATIHFENFNYYFHKSTPLILIIPKEYIRLNLPKAMNFDLSDQAKVCGFNPTVLNTVTQATTGDLLRELYTQQSTPFNQERFIFNLTSMFIPQKRNGELISPEQDTPWLIYISGHGHPAYLTVGPIRSQLKMFKSALTNPRMTITDHTGKPIARSTIESKVQEYEKQLQGKASWPDSQLIPESAQIAGITAAQFAQLMTFFDQSLNTAYIHYISCFAGGSNQSFVNETLSSLDVNYIVSAAGTHEASTYGSSKHLFGEFFRLLRMFFTNPEEYVKRKEKKQDPIIKIIKTLSIEKNERNPKNKGYIEQSLPFVRFPGAGFFEATSLNKQTKVLTQTMVKAHEIEKKPIDFSSTPVDMLVINTPRINILLNLDNKRINSNTAIVIPSPKNITPTYEALNVFKEIKSNSSLPLFLFNLIHLNGKAYPQTFVINTLTGIQTKLPGTQGLPIHNLIIHTQGIAGTNNMGSEQPVVQYAPLTAHDVRTSRIGMNVYIAFELNNTIYQTVFAIKNFDAPDYLRTSIEALTFTSTPKQSVNMNALASNFLSSQAVAQLAKPITLESIAHYIDSKIDTQNPSMALWKEADEEALRTFVTDKAKKQKS